ncbi:MAG: TlpA family protein disulfide reductase [Fulvivirga sp.]
MKRLISIALVISSLSSQSQTLEGEWKGSYILNSHVEKITAYILDEAQNPQVKLDAPDREVYDLDYNLSQKNDSVIFSRYNSQGNLFEFKGVRSGNTITGQAVLHSDYMKDKPGLFQMMRSNASLYRGSEAPPFEFKTIEGKVTTNDDFQGQYYMLDFWATWCKPCVAKRPKLEALKEKMGDDLEIVSISLDKSEAVVNTFRQKQFPMDWVHVLKSKKWDDPFVDKYVKDGLPYGYLMDKDGKVVAFGKELDAENFDKTVARVFE